MQINTIGFPLGAGMQSASATGGTGLGFADALGLAIDGPQPVSLKASATPPQNMDAMLAKMLAVQAQLSTQTQSMSTAGALQGLQQPTSMSELMATAAKLPGADALPLAATPPVALDTPVAVDARPDSVALETATAPLSAAPEIVTPAPASAGPDTPTPVTAPLPAETEIVTSAQASLANVPAIPTEDGGELPPEDDTPTAVTPAESAPPKPQKGSRRQAATADADPAPSADPKQALPVEMLAVNAVAQPVAVPQPTTREASANAQAGSTVSKTGKVTATAAPAQDGSQTTLGTTTADFARTVAAKGESAGSEPNPDGQPQPETVLAAAKTDAAAPAMPQPTQSTTSVDTARATAPAAPAAPAEPVIEARAGHLGHSLGVEIARKVELGEETLRIRLNPVELGRIEVTLSFDDKGSLQATVRTESAQAMDLLRQDAPDLARTLDQAGVRTDAQSFRFENRGGDGGGQQAQQHGQQNRSQFASSDDDAGIAEPIYRPIRSDGQVDLLA